jgi:hypothetical protein
MTLYAAVLAASAAGGPAQPPAPPPRPIPPAADAARPLPAPMPAAKDAPPPAPVLLAPVAPPVDGGFAPGPFGFGALPPRSPFGPSVPPPGASAGWPPGAPYPQHGVYYPPRHGHGRR